MKIASRQGKTLREAKRTNPSIDLPLWAAFFEWEQYQTDPSHLYLAQIALDVERSNQNLDISYRKKLKLSDKMFDLKPKAQAKVIGAGSGMTKEEIAAASKSAWLGWAGIAQPPR